MNRKGFHLSKFLSVMICLFISSILATSVANLRAQALAPFGAPILKWQLGGVTTHGARRDGTPRQLPQIWMAMARWR